MHTFQKVYEETRPEGQYFAEDHGANVLGVYFIKTRCRKPRYIATATGPSMEGVKQRIASFSANPY